MLICPSCGQEKPVKKLPFYCGCGAKVLDDGTFAVVSKSRPAPRTESAVASIVAICASCSYLHENEKVGAYCTHKNCRCGEGNEPVLIGEIRINSGMAAMIRRGGSRCPVRKW